MSTAATPGKRPGGAGVDALDARMGDGAVQHLGVQHAAALEIGGKSRLALHQLDGIHLGLGLADCFQVAASGATVMRGMTRVAIESGFAKSGSGAAGGSPSPGGSHCSGSGMRRRSALQRLDALAAQHRSSAQHRLHRLQVARAAAQHA